MIFEGSRQRGQGQRDQADHPAAQPESLYDKKRARLNCIAHLLSLIPYEPVAHQEVTLPERVHNAEYERTALPEELYVPSKY